MNPAFTETQALLSTSLRDYLAREVSSKRLHEMEAAGDWDSDLWEYLASAGYLQLPFPAEYGGQDGSLTDLAVVVEELARRPATVPFVETMVSALALPATVPQAAEIAGAVIRGSMTLSPAWFDGPGLDRPRVERGLLTGQKAFVDYGSAASHHLVAIGEEGHEGLYLVDASDPGVAVEPLPTIAKTPTALVTYDAAPAQRLAGMEGYRKLLSLGRAFSAVQCLGHAQRALDMTVEYVGIRVQFGRPIGQFQAVQHHIANMATMVTAARFLVYEALWKLDTGNATPEDVAVAKGWASKTATEVPMMAHQLHGGIGVTNDYDLQFLSRRGKERAVSWATAEDCLQEISNGLLG